jgi:F-type H+-transporting ATPase subunit delta
MLSSKVAKRYAQAFFEFAKEKQSLDDVAREIKDFELCLLNSLELRNFVRDPVLTQDQKKQVIRKLFESKLNGLIFNFLLFLVEKRRLNAIREICEAFDRLYLDHKNIAEVQITSAFPVDQKQVDAICQKLRDQFHKEVHSKVFTDPSLIGGMKVKTPEITYDFTFKTQLEKFRQSL